MKFKQAYKFQMSEILAPIKIYLCIITALEIVILILSLLTKDVPEMTGFGFSAGFFVLIIGACMFRGSFNFFSAHGVSRKTMLLSCFAVFATVAGIMVAFDIINSTAIIIMAKSLFHGEYISTFDTMFYFGAKQPNSDYINTLMYLPTFGEKVLRVLVNIAFNYICYFCLLILGYFTSILLYRLSMKIKLIVFIGMPFLFANGIPLLAMSRIKPSSKISIFINENIFKNPTGFILTELVAIAVFGFCAYKIASKASLKTIRS